MNLIKIQTDNGSAFVNIDNVVEVTIAEEYVYFEKPNGYTVAFRLETEQQAARLNRYLTNRTSEATFKGKVVYN